MTKLIRRFTPGDVLYVAAIGFLTGSLLGIQLALV